MAFKFNRSCWVESSEERILGKLKHKGLVPVAEGSTGNGRTGSDEGAGYSKSNGKSSLEEKIEIAEYLYNVLHVEFSADPILCSMLQRLKQDIAASALAMVEYGIPLACAHCDATMPEGSCCSKGLEEKYDAILLLMNLLAGVDIPKSRVRTDSCFFLGPQGCRIKVRHMLCIDYLCPDLEHQLGRDWLLKMQAISGTEIQTSFLTGEAIKRIIGGSDILHI